MRQPKKISIRKAKHDFANEKTWELCFTTEWSEKSSSTTVERLSNAEIEELFRVVVRHIFGAQDGE